MYPVVSKMGEAGRTIDDILFKIILNSETLRSSKLAELSLKDKRFS